MSEQEKGGAAAFIADVVEKTTASMEAMKLRQAMQIAKIRAVLQEVAAEEKPFVVADGVPTEFVRFASVGTALGAGAAAMGELFAANKPPHDPITDPFEIMRTVQSLANVFLSQVKL